MAIDPFAPPESFAKAFDYVHEAAATLAGSSDFGTPDYRPGLSVLLDSMDYDPRFTPEGRRLTWRQVVNALASRAIAFQSMAQNPGFERNAIERPVVIMGVPRTGTTALHKLMAVDPQFQAPEKWLLGAPIPRPARETWEAHPFFQKEVELMNARFGAAPEQRAAHNMVAEEVDECLWIQLHSFVSNYWTCNWSAATYDAWWQAQDELPSYHYLRRCLQIIGLNDRRRWLLKNPGHVLHLDLLFAIFPDAMVIQTHRDPAKAIPSLCALLAPQHAVMEVGRYQERARNMGVRETAKWAKGVRDAEPVRQARAGQIMDVRHADFHREPIATVRRIYDFAGMQLSDDAEAAMRARIAAAPETVHGVHRYTADEYGLSEDEIRERFGDYVDRFDLRPSSR
jgi:hypothetical protein